MHDYERLKSLYDCIHDDEDGCMKCPKCYRPHAKALSFNTDETTDIMFISESPNDYPNPQEGVCNSQDFIKKVLESRPKAAAQANRPPKSKPQDIFEFIYNTFRPVFDQKRQGEWAGSFLQTVYWTHAAKKSLKSFNEVKKKNAARQCADRLLRQELRAILPSTVIMASSIASRLLLGRGYAELFRQQERAESFLSLEEQSGRR